MSRSPKNRVQSVQRALQVLSVLTENQGLQGLSAIEVAQETGLDRTVVHRILRTLAAEGVVTSHDTSRYSLGPGSLLLGQAFSDRHAGRVALLPFAMDLHSRLVIDKPWIISISVPALDRLVIVERVWGRSTPMSMLLDVGTQFPIERLASGRALLARFHDDTVRQLLGPTRWQATKLDLEEIRRQDGLSVAHDELRAGMSAIAMAVGDDPASAAALVLAGTDLSEHAHQGSRVVSELRSAAEAAAHAVPTRSHSVEGAS